MPSFKKRPWPRNALSLAELDERLFFTSSAVAVLMAGAGKTVLEVGEEVVGERGRKVEALLSTGMSIVCGAGISDMIKFGS